MKKRNQGKWIAWALLAALILTLPAAASQYVDIPMPEWLKNPYPGINASPNPEPSAAVQEPERDAPVSLIPQSRGEHVKYMNGSSQGLFQPARPVTRAELAQMLNAVVADWPETVPAFSDVAWNAWYAPAVERVAGLGLMTGTEGAFRPNASATRAECAAALALLIPYDAVGGQDFPDVGPGHWAYSAIARTAGQGLLYGDDRGNFRPDDVLLRCEAAAVFNRLLGRSPDLGTIAQLSPFRFFPDVPSTHWAYGEIVEASVTHRCTVYAGGTERWSSADVEQLPVSPAAGLADGPYRIDGHLYWVINEDFARNQSVNGMWFDENGWYTTGNAELDGMLNELVDRLTGGLSTRDEKLRAMFNYVRDNFRYLKRPLISKGQTGWEPDYALYFLQNGKGNCYNFSAAYALMCRELGLPAYCVVGRALNSPHGWVEIVLDETIYLFDPQLAWRYLHDWGKTGYNFFKQPITKTTVKYTR